ncbi:MAG TPA: hypothetical protein VN959_16715, partial [Mycobacterium sp.]|nr:hypothetical protein [Mycobacterium sp.]
MPVISAESTELFAGPSDAPLQLVRVTFREHFEPVRVEGDGLTTAGQPRHPRQGVAEVPVRVVNPIPGERRAARVIAGGTTTPFTFTVAEPGWTMFMISHFHYDPVWWNTQAGYTSIWTADPPDRQTNG